MPLGFNRYFLEKGFEGQVANIQDYRHIAGTQEEYVNGMSEYLPFGRVVVRDLTDATKLSLPSQTGQTPLGIAIYNDRFMAQSDDPRVTGFPPNQTVPVLKKGVIYMLAETALTVGGALFFRHTVSASPTAFTAIGRVRNNADTATADAFPAGTFRVTENVAAGEIVAVHFDLSPVA